MSSSHPQSSPSHWNVWHRPHLQRSKLPGFSPSPSAARCRPRLSSTHHTSARCRPRPSPPHHTSACQLSSVRPSSTSTPTPMDVDGRLPLSSPFISNGFSYSTAPFAQSFISTWTRATQSIWPEDLSPSFEIHSLSFLGSMFDSRTYFFFSSPPSFSAGLPQVPMHVASLSTFPHVSCQQPSPASAACAVRCSEALPLFPFPFIYNPALKTSTVYATASSSYTDSALYCRPRSSLALYVSPSSTYPRG